MHWDSIIGQEKVVSLLKRTIESDHVAHAYLFHGLDGVGKRAAALAFAWALQYTDSKSDQTRSSRNQSAQIQHPDIQILLAEPSDAKADDVAQRIDLLTKDPYAPVDFLRAPNLGSKKNEAKRHKRAFYSVDRINLHLREKMILRPSMGAYRITIITDIDTIHERAANAFLKLLEEPGPDTVFILTTSRKDLLLPTILSRCQHVAFEVLPPDTIAKALQEHKGIEENLANVLANMSQGSYLRALELSQNESLRLDRERVLSFLRLAFTGKIGQQTDLISEISQSSRDGIRNLLRLLLGWIRDVALYRAMGEQALITNQDQRKEIAKFNSNLPSADLDAMIRLVEEALVLTESNAHTLLLLVNLSLRLGEAMRASHNGKLFTPLTIYSSL